MKRLLAAAAAVVTCALFTSAPARAQERYSRCAAATRSVHEIVPRLALHDFDGIGQTVIGSGYAFSRCLGDSPHRLRFEASYDHVEEEGSPYRADAVVLAAGAELRPFADLPDFAIVPMVRVGQERFRGDLHNTVLGASVIVSHTVRLGPAPAVDAKDYRSLILLDFRVDYTDRRSSNLILLGSDGGRATLYGAIGLDQRIAQSRWRWTARAGYQHLGKGPVDGYGQLLLSLRRLDTDHADYPWSAQVGFNLGDNGYRAALFIFSLRFSRGG